MNFGAVPSDSSIRRPSQRKNKEVITSANPHADNIIIKRNKPEDKWCVLEVIVVIIYCLLRLFLVC